MIQFYDNAQTGIENELGQLVQNYYVETLLNRNPDHGLLLHTGSPDWVLNPPEIKFFMDWASGKSGMVTTQPVTNPANGIIDAIQDTLSKHGKDTIHTNPEGYFAFKGALEHASYCYKILASKDDKSEQDERVITQLKTLADYEW